MCWYVAPPPAPMAADTTCWNFAIRQSPTPVATRHRGSYSCSRSTRKRKPWSSTSPRKRDCLTLTSTKRSRRNSRDARLHVASRVSHVLEWNRRSRRGWMRGGQSYRGGPSGAIALRPGLVCCLRWSARRRSCFGNHCAHIADQYARRIASHQPKTKPSFDPELSEQHSRARASAVGQKPRAPIAHFTHENERTRPQVTGDHQPRQRRNRAIVTDRALTVGGPCHGKRQR